MLEGDNFGSGQERLENLANQIEFLGIQDGALFTLRDAARSYVE